MKNSRWILGLLQPCSFRATSGKNMEKDQFAARSGPLMSPLPTKLLMSWEDIGTDHPDVPAFPT